jgi:hypothetical protein
VLPDPPVRRGWRGSEPLFYTPIQCNRG